MKLTLLALPLLASSASAFVPAAGTSSSSTTSLQATNRRDMLERAAGLLAGSAVVLVGGPTASFADSRPMYLTEPTEEFKANEAKAAEFRRQQLAQKKKFLDLLEKLTNEKDDEDALEAELIGLRKLVVETEVCLLASRKTNCLNRFVPRRPGGIGRPRSKLRKFQSKKKPIVF